MTALEGVADFMGYNSEIPKLRRERKAVLPYRSMSNWGIIESIHKPKSHGLFFLVIKYD
jgi:hypothetical protein